MNFIPLKKEWVLLQVNEYELFRHYIKGFVEIDKLFCSEIRSDPKASCIISEYNYHLKYHDFGSNDSYNVFDYISNKYNTDHYGALEIIAKDFLKYPEYISNSNPARYSFSYSDNTTIPALIDIRVKPFIQLDYDYWYKKYEIDIDTLKYYNVFSIKSFFIKGYWYKSEDLSFAYYFGEHNKVHRYKIYQPLSQYKWTSNTDANIIQGFNQLEQNDLLIITSSLKDVMCLYCAGFNAVALSSESTKLTNEHLEQLKTKTNCKQIITLYDNDEPGKKYAELIKLEYGIQSVFMPEGSKDPSEFVELYGLEKLREYVLEYNLSQ
jgi:hypothetical protein